MSYQVDQSNKIESTGDTALALSNDEEYTIRIPASEKRKAVQAMRLHFEGLSRKLVHIRLFAAALYYLLKELPSRQAVTIDIEYTGHEQNIKAMLIHWLGRDRPDLLPDDITFGLVGKKSPAHKKALAVYRGDAKADRVLRASDLMGLIVGR